MVGKPSDARSRARWLCPPYEGCGERKLFAFSGTIKRIKLRMPAAAVESNG
jgi:hypothetical protein